MNAPHMLPTTSPAPAAPKPAPVRAVHQPRPMMKSDEDSGGMKILTYLRLHWLMILFCGTLLGGVGAFVAWELLASKYESYALLQVSQVPSTVASGGNREQARTDFVTYLKTTSALLKSEGVLIAALRDIKDCPTIVAQKDPIKFLDEELMIVWQDGSEVVRVTFKSHEPADAKRIVDAVVNAFMKEVVEKDVREKQIFLKNVEDAKFKMSDILRQKVGDKPVPKGTATNTAGAVPAGGGEVIQAGGIPAPKEGAVPAGGMANANPMSPLPPIAPGVPAQPGLPAAVPPQAVEAAGLSRFMERDPRMLMSKVERLLQDVEKLPLQINEGRRRLELLQSKMDGIQKAPVSQLTIDMLEKDQDVVYQILVTTRARRAYEFRLNAASDANSPGVLELKHAWEANEAKLEKLRSEKKETFERARRIGEANKIAGEMETLVGNLLKLQEQYEMSKVLLAKADSQLAGLPLSEKGLGFDPRGIDAYNPVTSDLDSTDGIYRQLVRQFYLIQMELSSPPRVRSIQQASSPTQKDTKKQIIGTVFASLMGFGLIALGVVAFETMSRRVSSLSDVKNATPMPVVGVIPCQPSEVKDPLKRARANESIDKLRAYVSQTWLARGATSVAVTSPLGDEGKAFAAFGLATSLAQSGYKTLLVDFDLRDPQLHTYAGVANQNGVCELLRAEMDSSSAIQFLPSGLHLLPCGRWSEEARQAATGERLNTLLAKLKGPYDCVVLHGHALLTAAESVEVARRCEVVLVCAHYRETTTPLLKRAAERVATMEIPYSGIVYIGATEREGLC